MQYRYLFLYVLSIFVFGLSAQDQLPRNINLQASYLIEAPGADLAKRYGVNGKFEFKLEYLLSNNLAVYAKAGLRINQNVKEDVLATARTSEGFVFGVNGFYADLFGRKRGYDAGVGLDYLIPLKQHHLRFGIAGMFTTHWVNIVDDSRSVPSVLEEAGQFYDRYASGFGIEENIQYQYNIGRNRAAFLLGFQFGQAFTKEHRYKLIGNGASERRIDLYFGLKATYLLPLYRFDTKETIYY
jgi:hypothetical protein